MRIGQKVSKLRKDKKMSMRELGEKVGVSHAHISKLESGLNSASLDLLEKIAEYFNIDVSYFFTQDEEALSDEEPNIIYERDLSLESLKGKYNLEIDGIPATDEEIEKMVEYIKVLRMINKNQSS